MLYSCQNFNKITFAADLLQKVHLKICWKLVLDHLLLQL